MSLPILQKSCSQALLLWSRCRYLDCVFISLDLASGCGLKELVIFICKEANSPAHLALLPEEVRHAVRQDAAFQETLRSQGAWVKIGGHLVFIIIHLLLIVETVED